MRDACGFALEDLAIAWVRDVDGSDAFDGGLWADAGDWTGDGRGDALVSAPESGANGRHSGEIFLLSGDTVGLVYPDDMLGSWTGPSEDAGLGDSLFAQDVDGDGAVDILTTGATEEGGTLSVFQGGTVPSLHDPLPERMLVYGPGYWWGNVPGDVDGDGRADLFSGDATSDEVTRLGVVRGFDVPWDDPTYW
jgi:hypothetical protein